MSLCQRTLSTALAHVVRCNFIGWLDRNPQNSVCNREKLSLENHTKKLTQTCKAVWVVVVLGVVVSVGEVTAQWLKPKYSIIYKYICSYMLKFVNLSAAQNNKKERTKF